MREPLFRAQTRRYGEKVYAFSGKPVPGNWVYGFGCMKKEGGDFAIIYSYDGSKLDKTPVYAETCGQFTGICDRNGTKIFEGDIIVDEYGTKYTIKEVPGWWGYQAIPEDGSDEEPMKYEGDENGMAYVTVIGNIFEPLEQ